MPTQTHDEVTILHLEADPVDAELIRETLVSQGFKPNTLRAETEDQFRLELQNMNIDLILADYALPAFDGISALKIAREMRPDLPFIFVSGTIGEEVAIESLKSGATDYVLKQRLQRLTLSINRALSGASERRRRMKADQALRESEERHRLFFEGSPLPMWVYDLETRQFLAVNEAAIQHYGYTRDEFLALTSEDVHPAADVERLLDCVEKPDSEISTAGVTRHCTKDGTVIEVEITSHRIDYFGRPAEVVLANDVTERKRAEEEQRTSELRYRRLFESAKEANHNLELALKELQAKSEELATMTQQLWQASKLATMGELAASIAHELNNPLATVALRTEAVMEQLQPDDSTFHSVKIISQEVERMASLVGNLLQFSRRSHPEISTLDLREELANSLEFIEHYLRSHKVNVVQDFADDLPNVHADRQQLRQVFLNLITNASDAMPHGGTLTLRAFSGVLGSRPAVVVEFSDNGTGVQTGDLPKLWEPFFTTKPEGKGTGLGLAICRRTVEEHHGTIDIKTGPGKGATVRITLPAIETGEATKHE